MSWGHSLSWDDGGHGPSVPRARRDREGPAGPAAASVRAVVGVDDLGRDAAAVGDGVAVVTRPLANLRGVARPAARAAGAARAAAAAGGPAPTRTAGVPDPGGHGVAQLGGILGREVDLVVHTVEAEQDRLVRGGPVDVIDKSDHDLLHHLILFPACQPLGPSEVRSRYPLGEIAMRHRLIRGFRIVTLRDG